MVYLKQLVGEVTSPGHLSSKYFRGLREGKGLLAGLNISSHENKGGITAEILGMLSLFCIHVAGHVGAGRAHFYLHDHELSRSPPDDSFIMLKQNCCLSCPHFPPPSIVEAFTRLCHQLSQGTSVTSHCGRPVAAMEVQTLTGPGRLLTNFGAFLIVMTLVG